jgi:hypothetical protein
LTGWKIDDDSNSSASAVPLLGVTSLPAGKSAVFFEDTGGNDSTIQTAFTQAWFSLNAPPAGFLIGHYGGSGVGLSASNGDQVNIFDAAGNRVTGVAFGPAPTASPTATFDNAAGAGSSGATAPPTISTLSVVGTDSAILSAEGKEVGSPGSATVAAPAPPVVISEIAPWGSGNTPYKADWFELTNNGTSTVDLTGWKMDDNSNDPSLAVPLLGVSSLPAGKSAVFFEDTGIASDPTLDATIETAFAHAWFGTAALPSGFLIGHYAGSGVGLSTTTDAVNIFDSAGNRVTGVAFDASPSAAPFASFDNTAGAGSTSLPLPKIATLSAVGVNGAFLSKDNAEIGSPAGAAPPDRTPPTITATANPAANANGWNNTAVTVSYTCTDTGVGVDPAASSLSDDVLTASGTASGECVDLAGNAADANYTAQIDTVAPVVAFTGNSGSYGVLATVAIACTASDALSGVDTSTCPSASGPGWSFGAGSHTLSATATDKAGNVKTASTTFAITVAPNDLSKLTTQFVQSSPKYQAANAITKLVVSAAIGVASKALLDVAANASRPTVKAALLKAYDAAVQGLVSAGWLSATQATTLQSLAGAL